MTHDVLLVESVDQAAILLKPLRIALLREMGEPRTCPELADRLGETPQKIYYHVKTMERARLVERSGERIVNGIVEGFYRARALSYWLSPRLVWSLGGARAVRDQTSLRMLAGHAEAMLEDVARLGERSVDDGHVPSLSLAVDVALPSVERRAAFLGELKATFEDLARRYGALGGDPVAADETFRFTLACYPTLD